MVMPFYKISGIVSFLLLLFLAVGCSSAEEEALQLCVEKSVCHRDVFDMPVLIVLPENCSFSKTRSGCADRAKKISFEASVIRLPFPALLNEFNEMNLDAAEMELKMKSEFVLNGSSAVLMKIFQKKGSGTIGKWTLIIDRGKECWMLNGLYPAKDPVRGEAVLKTIKSAYWEEVTSSSPAPMMAVGRIEDRRVPLKLAGLRDGAIVYTKDGLLPTQSEDGSLFVLSRLSNVLVTPDKRAAFARERFGMIEGGESVGIISEKETTVDGLHGYEIVGSTSCDEKKLIYQMMLFDGTNSHVMVGIARSDPAGGSLALFQGTAGTFKTVR